MTETAKNIILLLSKNSASHPNVVALRYKQLGIWQQLTWADLAHTVQHYSQALKNFGLKAKQKIVILTEPSLHFFAMIFAAKILDVQIHFLESKNTNELNQLIQLISPEYIFIDDLAQFDLRFPTIYPIQFFYLQDRRIDRIIDTQHHDLQKFLDRNQLTHSDLSIFTQDNTVVESQNLDFYFHKFEQHQHYQLAHSEQALIHEAEQLMKLYRLTHDEQTLITPNLLSRDHICYLFSTWLVAGFSLNIPETSETHDQDQKVISPTLVLGNPAIYEHLYRLAQQKLPPHNSWIYRIAPALKHWQSSASEQDAQENMISKIFDSLFKQSLLETLGCGNVRTALNMGIANPHTTTVFFQRLGIHISAWNSEVSWQHHSPPISPTSSRRFKS